ncbi:hypothetical protein NL108_008506 [Boleophthalmus pectinirostris]|uniref:profilin-like n=1 Tax=Boleophthalmus pectinirostris TaxID=150288 RepID=UPI000A1C1B04|nr:profilin-like [Boleophthalmus pectinirostris]KAJ0060297.1 hypothetical protein NL108_008506 [Boleophthalmus pectinirostris]
MSWDAYITNLQHSKLITDAVICSHDGTVWAKNANFTPTPEELKGLNGTRNDLYQRGVKLSGRKFHVLRHEMDDPNEPHMNLKSIKDESGKTCNATVYKTKQTLVVGIGSPDAQGGAVALDVCKMGKYLTEAGY